MMTDLSRCPKCDGPADNGYDREVPPNPYHCTKCMAELQGCVLCNHPMYAGIKCRLCGKVTEPAPPPDAQTEAEKVAYCAGWWAALETARKAEPVQGTEMRRCPRCWEPMFPPQRTPLPASDIVTMYDERPMGDSDMIEFARAVERAHGIVGKA